MNSEGTIRPGDQIDSATATRYRAKLEASLENLFNAELSSSVPIACRIQGEHQASFPDNSVIAGKQIALILFENINEIRGATISEIRNYFACKEPWEDYDICVFDESFSWFIACSHNNRFIVIGKDATRSE